MLVGSNTLMPSRCSGNPNTCHKLFLPPRNYFPSTKSRIRPDDGYDGYDGQIENYSLTHAKKTLRTELSIAHPSK